VNPQICRQPRFEPLSARRIARVIYRSPVPPATARRRAIARQRQGYRCYASAEELTSMREKRPAPKAAPASITASGATATSPSSAGIKPTIRLKAPQTGETVIEDQVQGRVVWQNENLDDLVLLRGDGNPTYMLAVVVDDHDMASPTSSGATII